MNGLESALRSAESHLQSTERKALELARRIRTIDSLIRETEINVKESRDLIDKAEKRVSLLSSQQSQTKRKLSSLYCQLITVSGDNTHTKSESSLERSSETSSQDTNRRDVLDNLWWNVTMYNAICTAKGSALFSHAGMFLSSSEGGNERSQSEAILETNGSGVMRVDPMLPLCTYELCGRCTDENCRFQHLGDTSTPLPPISEATQSSKRTVYRKVEYRKYLKEREQGGRGNSDGGIVRKYLGRRDVRFQYSSPLTSQGENESYWVENYVAAVETSENLYPWEVILKTLRSISAGREGTESLLDAALTNLCSNLDNDLSCRMDERAWIVYLLHIELLSPELQPTHETLLRILSRFPRSWAIHAAVERVLASTSPFTRESRISTNNDFSTSSDAQDSSSQSHMLGNGLGVYTLTFAALGLARGMWATCSGDLACVFLANLLYIPHSSLPFHPSCTPFTRMHSAEGSLEVHWPDFSVLGFSCRDIMKVIADEGSGMSLTFTSNILWAVLLYLMLTGEYIGDRILRACDDDNAVFVPTVDWNTAVMNCRSLMEKAPQLGIRVLDLLKRAHCDVTAVDIAVSLEAHRGGRFTIVLDENRTSHASDVSAQCVWWCTLLFAESGGFLDTSIVYTWMCCVKPAAISANLLALNSFFERTSFSVPSVPNQYDDRTWISDIQVRLQELGGRLLLGNIALEQYMQLASKIVHPKLAFHIGRCDTETNDRVLYSVVLGAPMTFYSGLTINDFAEVCADVSDVVSMARNSIVECRKDSDCNLVYEVAIALWLYVSSLAGAYTSSADTGHMVSIFQHLLVGDSDLPRDFVLRLHSMYSVLMIGGLLNDSSSSARAVFTNALSVSHIGKKNSDPLDLLSEHIGGLNLFSFESSLLRLVLHRCQMHGILANTFREFVLNKDSMAELLLPGDAVVPSLLHISGQFPSDEKVSYIIADLLMESITASSLSLTYTPDILYKLSRHIFVTENFDFLYQLHSALVECSHPTAGFNCALMDSSYAPLDISSVGESVERYKHLRESFARDSLELSSIATECAVKLCNCFAKCEAVDIGNSKSAPLVAELGNSFNGTVALSICQLTPLSSLTLSHNDLVTFPKHILLLTNLKRLSLSWNQLSLLPKGISCLLNLKILDISHNRFKDFPKSVLRLKSLTELYMQDNSVEEIRNDIIKLERLEALDVSNNRLRMLPTRIHQALKLKFFKFSGNPLSVPHHCK